MWGRFFLVSAPCLGRLQTCYSALVRRVTLANRIGDGRERPLGEYGSNALADALARLVPLHALGSAFMLATL